MDSAAGDEDEEEVVAVLDRDSWEDRTQEAELALVHFHTDWCRHCRSPQYIARWQIKYLIFVEVKYVKHQITFGNSIFCE